ncbi:Trm112 family protein [Rheinheimera sp. MMS21-TC3]|uniref:Trm112 family protein n=1 Tax=Rheinheimera sp. MMS21-TC3 TaxID=3072790 RepID=UPI0028C445E7|nr:Trm112 family protein [Rheinheimera sp. MMS21-TC3]WNO61196.1 Trm112 family protein [Rheinheimera sp. MMS21-TC3]
MALKVALTDILACPVCKGKLKYSKEPALLICLADKLAYPIRDNIPVLIEEEAQQLTTEEVEQWRS